jgi:hypothetical protein
MSSGDQNLSFFNSTWLGTCSNISNLLQLTFPTRKSISLESQNIFQRST